MGASGDGGAVRIPLSEGFFDLREVMGAVGDLTSLRWVLRDVWFNGDVRPVWPEGHEHAEGGSEEPGGLPLTWAQMASLAESCQQVIDGRFTGYDEHGQPSVQLQAIDSSYWVVWARNHEVLAAVTSAFPTAEAYDEPTPETLCS
jgi:hypothetical protein